MFKGDGKLEAYGKLGLGFFNDIRISNLPRRIRNKSYKEYRCNFFIKDNNMEEKTILGEGKIIFKQIRNAYNHSGL